MQQLWDGSRQHSSGVRERGSPDEHQVTAYVEAWIFTGQLCRIVKCAAIRHERCGGEYAARMRFNDASIHIVGEAEIIGIDNQPSQNRASLIRRNFFGFARTSRSSCCISPVTPVKLS